MGADWPHTVQPSEKNQRGRIYQPLFHTPELPGKKMQSCATEQLLPWAVVKRNELRGQHRTSRALSERAPLGDGSGTTAPSGRILAEETGSGKGAPTTRGACTLSPARACCCISPAGAWLSSQNYASTKIHGGFSRWLVFLLLCRGWKQSS